VKKYIPVVFKLLVWCGAEGYVSGLQDAGITDPPSQTIKRMFMHFKSASINLNFEIYYK